MRMEENVFERDVFDDGPRNREQAEPRPGQKRLGRPPPDERPAEFKRRTVDMPLQRFLNYMSSPANQNPISVLNECRFDVAYTTASSDGPVHQPLFTISAKIRGLEFCGSGGNKKQAKEEAARTAVEFLKIAVQTGQFPTDEDGQNSEKLQAAQPKQEPQEPRNPPSPGNTVSTQVIGSYLTIPTPTSVSTFIVIVDRIRSLSFLELSRLQDLLKQGLAPTDTVCLAQKIAALFVLPVMLEEKARNSPDIPGNLEVDSRHFIFHIRFADTSFYGFSHAKKAAKQNVCAQFLNWLLDVLPIAWRSRHLQAEINGPSTRSKESSVEVEESFTSRVFAAAMDLLIYRKLEEIYCRYAGSSLIEYVDLGNVAAVCLSQAGVLTPIAIASGSSVIYRKYLSARGRTLKDCQAEILVLRATRRYLLQQVLSFLSGQESIFRSISNSGKLELKDDIGFHLYVTRCPSGSCSIFRSTAWNITDQSETDEKHSELKLRTVINRFHCINGELASTSCYPVEDTEYPPALADLTEGRAKLRVMSASDKILRRLVVGIQGSLASNFIHPVFLQTICIQSPEKLSSMASGLYERILPEAMKTVGQTEFSEFPMVCPEICGDSADLSEAGRFDLKNVRPMSAFVWATGVGTDPPLKEFINTTNGLQSSNEPSALTKKAVAVLFRQVLVELQKKTAELPEALKDLSELYANSVVAYADLKAASANYRKKGQFFLLVTRSLGQWMGKCSEEDEFVCPG